MRVSRNPAARAALVEPAKGAVRRAGGWLAKRMLVRLAWACRLGSLGAIALLCATGLAVGAPQRQEETPTAAALLPPAVNALAAQSPVFRLDMGLAGPPLLAPDGTWWLLGRDGEVARVRADDSLDWAIALGTAINRPAAIDDAGVIYIPTARDLIYALEPTSHVRWRSRIPGGMQSALVWVPGQGLVYVSRDQWVYWLGPNANILLRTPLRDRPSVGPTRVGSSFAIGTDDGDLLLSVSRGQLRRVALGTKIVAIRDGAGMALVLAGHRACAVDAHAAIAWCHDDIRAIGTASGSAPEADQAVLLDTSGQLRWLDQAGRVLSSFAARELADDGWDPEFVAADRCAWFVNQGSEVWQACSGAAARRLSSGQQTLMPPTIDTRHRRVLVSATQGNVYAIQLAPAASP